MDSRIKELAENAAHQMMGTTGSAFEKCEGAIEVFISNLVMAGYGIAPLEKISGTPEREALRNRAQTLWDKAAESVKSAEIEAQARQLAEQAALLEKVRKGLGWLVKVIDSAGVYNLSNGVQLGQTSWFVKCSDAMDYNRALLAKLQPDTGAD